MVFFVRKYKDDGNVILIKVELRMIKMSNINWHADLEQIALELPRLHKNLFFNLDEETFYSSLSNLKERLENLDTYSIVMEIARIIASIGDAHTAVAMPRHNRLPFECYWFQEGIFITSTLPQFGNLLHYKVVKIEGISIEDVIERLSSIISYENESFLRSQLPDYLICADLLIGLDVINNNQTVNITVENLNNEQIDVNLPTIKYETWQSAALLASVNALDELPLYRKNSEKFYWSEFNSEKKLLYINYNQCKDMQTYTVSEFSQQLRMDIQVNSDIQRLVIDLRNNGGGNSELFRGFLTWLSTFQRLNCNGKLFVIVGRDTFSSALLNTYLLKFDTAAIFLGEPTGGKPNCYGEVKYLSLNSSGLYIRYSTKYYELIDDNTLASFMPDVLCEVTFENYIRNSDPCLDWIYNFLECA